METLDIARRLAELGQKKSAQEAYTLFLRMDGDKTPKEELEAASFLFFSQADYKLPYDTFLSLFRRGQFQGEVLNLMSQAFYFPNLPDLQKQYERNCRILKEYPYFFRTDFPPFEELPTLFFPYEKGTYIPYYSDENVFGACVDFHYPVVDQNFFRDLENPVLGTDVYSQYQLEYLNDTVRRSEWVGRENHIYLHYTDWTKFCNYLQCLDFRKLLKDEKFVFLFEEEIAQYPINFQERFGIDYSQYPVKPLGVREVNRLIWHSQLSSHNGGDFFNEIFHDHPNLLIFDSIMFENAEKIVKDLRAQLRNGIRVEEKIYRLLAHVKNPTDKDLFIAVFLGRESMHRGLDKAARIAPALFFQPHFHNIYYTIRVYPEAGRCTLISPQYEEIRISPLFQQFKYIKTFVPMRRPTTSYAAATRFALTFEENENDPYSHLGDIMSQTVLNRAYWADPQDRLFQDSVIVRFEDAKLNPKATFTALAEFLDLPYTSSMTYCSNNEGLNPESLKGNEIGFSTAAVYRTYDEYVDDSDRAFIEYFLRDAYEAYGYDFHYYHGEPVDKNWVQEQSEHATKVNEMMAQSHEESIFRQLVDKKGKEEEDAKQEADLERDRYMKESLANRLFIGEKLLLNLPFANKQGELRRMIPLLKPNPELLDQPLYH